MTFPKEQRIQMQQFLQSYHKEKALMANAIFDLLAANQITRGIPIGPSSLAWKIESLIKNTDSLSDNESYHSTTTELNAAFLEFISQQTALEVASLLREWATFFNRSSWGASGLDPEDLLAVLDTLVNYIKMGLENLLRTQRESCDSEEVEKILGR